MNNKKIRVETVGMMARLCADRPHMESPDRRPRYPIIGILDEIFQSDGTRAAVPTNAGDRVVGVNELSEEPVAKADGHTGTIFNVAPAAKFGSTLNSLVESGIMPGITRPARATWDVGRRNVRVNSAARSAIPIKGTIKIGNAARVAETPLRRLATVEDIAPAIGCRLRAASNFAAGQAPSTGGGGVGVAITLQ